LSVVFRSKREPREERLTLRGKQKPRERYHPRPIVGDENSVAHRRASLIRERFHPSTLKRRLRNDQEEMFPADEKCRPQDGKLVE
jgi:hypothetical protein